MNKEKVSMKNYFILFIIVLVTIVIIWYLLVWYHEYNSLEVNTPVIYNTISEVKYDNLSTVAKERDLFVLYACTTDDKVCRNLEVSLKSYLIDNNLTEDFFYLNLGKDCDCDDYLDTIYKKFKSDDLVKKVKGYPTLFLFANGEIVDLLSVKNKGLAISDIQTFVEGYDF